MISGTCNILKCANPIWQYLGATLKEGKDAKGLEFQKRDGVIFLVGHVDEYADFKSLLNEQAPLTLNFKGLKRLNSVGVRNLLGFIHQWGDKPLVYQECPDVLIDQISMVQDLLGFGKKVAEIESFYAPYVCVSCEHEAEFLIQMPDLTSAKSLELKNEPCPKCGSEMESELSPEFLQFLTDSD